jgi:hypothetical protein
METLHLGVGVELHCPHCGSWHPATVPYAGSTTAEQTHVYVTCAQGRFFVGTVGSVPRWPARVAEQPKGGA